MIEPMDTDAQLEALDDQIATLSPAEHDALALVLARDLVERSETDLGRWFWGQRVAELGG